MAIAGTEASGMDLRGEVLWAMSSVIGFLNLAIPFDLLRFPALSSVSPNWSNWT